MPPVAPPLVTALLQTGVAPSWVAEHFPLIVSAARFFAGVLAVVLAGRYVFEPVVSGVVSQRNRNNPTIQEAILRYVRVFVLVLAFVVGTSVAGYGGFLSDSALVIAAATLAIGVAAQTVIGSLVSGLVLVTDPEFNIGNYIRWADGEGTVQSITLRVTRVLTQDGELVTIPNTVLTSQAITRPFGRGRTRVVERVDLAYEADVEEALAELTAAAAELDDVLDAPTPSAFVDDLGADAVVVRVHYWIEDPRRRDLLGIRSEFAKAVKRRLEDADITINPPSKRELQGRLVVDESA